MLYGSRLECVQHFKQLPCFDVSIFYLCDWARECYRNDYIHCNNTDNLWQRVIFCTLFVCTLFVSVYDRFYFSCNGHKSNWQLLWFAFFMGWVKYFDSNLLNAKPLPYQMPFSAFVFCHNWLTSCKNDHQIGTWIFYEFPLKQPNWAFKLHMSNTNRKMNHKVVRTVKQSADKLKNLPNNNKRHLMLDEAKYRFIRSLGRQRHEPNEKSRAHNYSWLINHTHEPSSISDAFDLGIEGDREYYMLCICSTAMCVWLDRSTRKSNKNHVVCVCNAY